MRKRIAGIAAGGAGLAAGIAAAAYPMLWRQQCMTWGATADEAASKMPGDDLLPNPDMLSTRAITIGAPPAVIWPWLVQRDSGRAVTYPYTVAERLAGRDT